MSLRPLFLGLLAFAAAPLLTGCGGDGPTAPRKLVCDKLPVVESKDLSFGKFFYPGSALEQAADLASPSKAIKKYGWYLDAKIRVTNPNEKAIVFDTLDSYLTISAPGDTTGRRFPASSAPLSLGPKKEIRVSARFTVRMNELGSELSRKFLDHDVLGYQVEHRFAFRLADTAGCGDIGPSSGADTTVNNTDAEKNVYGSSVAATAWTISNWDSIWTGFKVALAILSAILKVAGHV